MPRLGPICKKLGVDYAPAMTGFDIRGGRSVPTIEGVVICKEDEATVLEAYLEEEQCVSVFDTACPPSWHTLDAVPHMHVLQ